MGLKSVDQYAGTASWIFIGTAACLAAIAPQPALATDVCGSVCDETWTAASSPYVLTCDVNVGVGCTLTVDAGVEVLSDPGAGLWISGTLDVNGTSGSRVTFDSSAGAPDWAGVAIQGNSTSTLDYANIYNADKGIFVAGNANVDLVNVWALYNLHALYVESHGLPSVTATDCKFTFNGATTGESAIDIRRVDGFSNPSVTINQSSIHDNLSDYDVHTQNFAQRSEYVLDFRDNWWGDTDADSIDARIADDEEGEAVVDWCGFLNAEGGSRYQDGYCPELYVCDGEVTWSQTDKPYYLTPASLTVCDTGTLLIEAGVNVLVRPRDSLEIKVGGTLEVNGTAGSPVRFQSGAVTPLPDDWRGIELYHFDPTAAVTVHHAEVFHASAAFWLEKGSATLQNVVAQYNGNAIQHGCAGPLDLYASDCVFTNNEGIGIDMTMNCEIECPSVTIRNSEIHHNGTFNYAAGWSTSPRKVHDLRYNWWGTGVASEIAQKMSEGPGVGLDWCNYLDDVPGLGSPARDVVCPDLGVCDGVTTWTETNKPYLLTTDLSICPTGELRIDPGVEIRFMPGLGNSIMNYGLLDVNGSLGSPVVFTSDSETPQAGDWSGLTVRGSADLLHGDISYADVAVRVYDSGTVSMEGMTIRDGNTGLHSSHFVLGEAPTVIVTGCEFTRNISHSVHVNSNPSGPNPSVTITDSSFHENLGPYDYYVEANFMNPESSTLNAQGNWWGTQEATVIASRIHDRDDNPGSAKVEWCAFLDEIGGIPADVECPSTVICNGTSVWDHTDRPYQITGKVYICPTGTLQVEAGVEVRFVKISPALSFVVDGTLQVNGTEGAPVTITSDSSTPAAGDWGGLSFEGVLPSTLNHATVEYGANGIWTGDDVDLTVTGTTLRYNDTGLNVRAVYGATPVVNITESRIIENSSSGIYLYDGNGSYLGVTINRSEIHSNAGTYDYNLDSTLTPHKKVLNARENWWGWPDPAVFGPRIFDYRVNNKRPLVDFCRYLDRPGGSPVVDAHCPDLAVCDETVSLDLTDKPYQLTSDMYVCGTGTLEISPGVSLLVAAGSPLSDIQVHGVLNVNGTEEAPVTFGSDAAVPQAEDWTGLYLASSSVSNIDWAEVNHALNGIDVTGSATATLNGVTARFNRDGWVVGGYGPPAGSATDCTFTDNTRYGIRGWTYTGRANPTLTVNRSSIHSNGPDHDFYYYPATAAATTVFDARDNWWGITDPTVIGPRIYDHRTRDGAPIVDWCGYVDADGDPVRETHCPDLVPCNETVVLDQTDLPYLLTSDLTVCDTGTLQIEPGVEVRTVITTPRPDFLVQGVLDVNGTAAQPVVFTSDPSTIPQVGDWRGVVLAGSSISAVEHAKISWADRGIYVTDNATATLEGVTIQRNHDGLYVQGSGAQTVTASGCSITDNNNIGIWWRHTYGDGPDLTVTRSALHSNLGSHDFYTSSAFGSGGRKVWATDNWWDTTDPSAIEARIYDHDESSYSPRVYFQAFGDECDYALGRDSDGDGYSDFEDNCVTERNVAQGDIDGDSMGDACDPEPGALPLESCDGFNDVLEGYLDSDGDGWGDPCDHQPLRADSYPGAPELCDGRDNDGDGLLAVDEPIDDDYDEGVACGDCDDAEPLANVCMCEECGNLIDDDCDLAADAADTDCQAYPTCITLTSGVDPDLMVVRGECGGATLAGPFDVIRGDLAQLQFNGSQVDLGGVASVQCGLDWDRVSDYSLNPNPRCVDVPGIFFLGRKVGDPDFGTAHGGEPRDLMTPDPVCP